VFAVERGLQRRRRLSGLASATVSAAATAAWDGLIKPTTTERNSFFGLF